MVKVKVLWGNDLYNSTWQDKSFKDEMAALQFLRMHTDKIYGVNSTMFHSGIASITHFELMDAIKNPDKCMWP